MGAVRSAAPGGAALIVASEGRLAAMPLRDVIEIMRPRPVTAIAGMPRFMLGVAVIRGAAVPAIDLAALVADAPAAARARFVSVRVGDRHVALAVDEVLGVRDLGAPRLDALPPLLRDATPALDAIATLDAQLLLVIRGARAIPASVWAAMDGAR